ncbi:MAG: hypothetical protein ACR2JB_19025 [Bryobacteraceae bacterium]
MKRSQLRRLFRKHWGESARLARELKVSPVKVSRWFHGEIDSIQIEAAVFARAAQLLKQDTDAEREKTRAQKELASAQSSAA